MGFGPAQGCFDRPCCRISFIRNRINRDFPQEIGDTGSDFMSYPLMFSEDGALSCIIVTLLWDTAEDMNPLAYSQEYFGE